VSGESLIIILLVGLIAGWLAGRIVKGTGFGLVADLCIGIIGAFIRNWLLPRLGIHLGIGILASVSWPPSSPPRSAPFCFWSFLGSSTDAADGELVAARVDVFASARDHRRPSGAPCTRSERSRRQREPPRGPYKPDCRPDRSRIRRLAPVASLSALIIKPGSSSSCRFGHRRCPRQTVKGPAPYQTDRKDLKVIRSL
jgi:uncharacterized membrane protein YeaQ/YmgE (transglycosylase-associated protein family)